MAYEFIIAEQLDGVGFVTLNRPDKLNALSFGLVSELDDVLTGWEEDDEIKAVIITGEGTEFCTGMDVGHFDMSPKGWEILRSEGNRLLKNLVNIEVPVIGAVN